MIKHQRQPDGESCGPTCVAMLLGVPVEEVLVDLPPRYGGTSNTRMFWYLRNRGMRPSETLHCSFGITLGDLALCKVKWGAASDDRTHWVLWADGRFYDPLVGPDEVPRFIARKGRVLSYMTVTIPESTDPGAGVV